MDENAHFLRKKGEKMKIINIVLLLFLMASFAMAQEYQIDWSVIASGGGQTESGSYQVSGTIGQPIVGQTSSENYSMEAGFWAGVVPGGGDCVYIPGDCNHNGSPLELGDVIAMIGMYRGSVVPPYECSCPPHGDDFTPTADPNGNCVPLELGDVVTEIGAYRGSATASGCPDCPGTLRLLPGGDNRPLVIPRLKLKAKADPKLSSD
jgi:hypothetical protein